VVFEFSELDVAGLGQDGVDGGRGNLELTLAFRGSELETFVADAAIGINGGRVVRAGTQAGRFAEDDTRRVLGVAGLG